jgi:methionine-rich copper-binding protein CopC
MRLSFVSALTFAALTIAAIPASAEVRLVDATPAASASASKVDKVVLHFSAPIAPASLAVDLTMTGMPGMAHHNPMKVTGFTSTVSPDATTATLTLPRALPVGTYEVHWRLSPAGDGTYGFTVR